MLATALTEGEQNRLILEHQELVAKIASEYRGRKGIPFEELCSEGMVGLVQAARMWAPTAQFATYATHKIRSAIMDFIDRWQVFVPLDAISEQELEDRLHEWQNWGTIPYHEDWDELSATPEDVVAVFDDIAQRRDLIGAALIGLSRREKQMIEARFLRDPPCPLEQIARDHTVSYKNATNIIYRALKKMRDAIENILKNQSGESRKGRHTLRAGGSRSADIVPFTRRAAAR